MSMSIGSSSGFSAVAIPQLTDEDSFRGDDFSWFGILFNIFNPNIIHVSNLNKQYLYCYFEITIKHNTHFTASIPLAAMAISCVLGGVLGEQVGRKSMIVVVAPLLGVGYIIQGVAKDPGLLNTGRFISGIAGGLACGPGAVNHKIFATCQK